MSNAELAPLRRRGITGHRRRNRNVRIELTHVQTYVQHMSRGTLLDINNHNEIYWTCPLDIHKSF